MGPGQAGQETEGGEAGGGGCRGEVTTQGHTVQGTSNLGLQLCLRHDPQTVSLWNKGEWWGCGGARPDPRAFLIADQARGTRGLGCCVSHEQISRQLWGAGWVVDVQDPVSACSSWEKPGGPDLPWCHPALPHTRFPGSPLPLPDLGCPVRAGRGHNTCCSLLGALAVVEAKTGPGWGRWQGAWSTSPVPGPQPRMGCQPGAPAGLWALHEEDGEVTTPHRGKMEARRGSATCPGPQGGLTHSWAPACPLGGGSCPSLPLT